jgi:NADPH:quinone reductase-like Zn-dependent oxidoreductase
MKAMVIEKFGHEEQLHFEDLPTPKPTDNEVQIQVLYASVNPVDWKIREGLLKNLLPHEFPLIPGWDAAGVVTAVGKNVKTFKVNDEVFAYCRKPVVKWGTYAEYVCFDANNVALKPKTLNFAEAAAIPLAGLTAWQAIFDFLKLKKGETILIHAGAGGVGSFAIQFAKYAEAKILTTASKQNHDYVKTLGADYAIDYHKSNFVNEVKKLFPNGIDVVFDTVGGKTLQESLEILKPKGRIVSIIEQLDPELARAKNVQSGFVFVSPNGYELKQIASLIEQGKVCAPRIHEMPLSEASKAHEKSREGHTCGKIVLKIK